MASSISSNINALKPPERFNLSMCERGLWILTHKMFKVFRVWDSEVGRGWIFLERGLLR
jgi:hypothetical protein